MKFIKRASLIFLILITIGLLFRGLIFRRVITYYSLGERVDYTVNDAKLVRYIEANTKHFDEPGIHQIIKQGLSITSKQLNFTASKNEIDPNKLITTKAAHCIGYASFFSATCNYLLDKYELSDDWFARPHIGQLYFFGINIHNYCNSSFFRDHDFVIIENRLTAERLAVDPTVNDYFMIDFVSFNELPIDK